MAKKIPSLEKMTPALLVISILLAFAVGILWQKVSMLEGGKTTKTTTTGTGSDTAAQAQPQAPPTIGKISAEQAANLPEVTSADHIRGTSDPKAYMIEYSDFECPFCARFHPTTQQVLDEYGDEVALVYRHFPLDAIHPKARPAAVASECIAELGGNDAFWSFVDLVFADQTTLSDLEALAVDSGVSAGAFNTCVDSGKYDDLVEEQLTTGQAAGVRGTPGSFIVNQKGEVWFVPGAYPYESVKTSIEEALAS